MTPPRPVEEVARAMADREHEMYPGYSEAWDNCPSGEREDWVIMAVTAIRRLRDLGMLNPETLDLLKHEGQYEATRPSRYVFPAEEGK
jgi:hypothetical protein